MDKKVKNCTLNGSSRYSALKEKIDEETFNKAWIEIDTNQVNREQNMFTFVDLFSGAGGMSYGFKNAGYKKIFSVEVDHDASETIRRNFPNSVHYEKKIEDLTYKEIDHAIKGSDIDVVCGGPPCQGFSVAGLRNPKDPRNMLFLEFLRVVKYIKPKFVVIENVPGILTMEKGKVFKEIMRQLEELGYITSVRILEAAQFGVPQLRTRAFFIANRLKQFNPYPKPKYSRHEYKTIDSFISDLKDVPEDPSFNHNGTWHGPQMIERIAQVPPGGSLYDTFRDAWKRQHRGAPSMAIKENHGGVHIHYELNRVLTVREMARLQTFPDSFIFSGRFKRCYWQVGNAVPCLLAKEVALAVKSGLLNLFKMKKKNVIKKYGQASLLDFLN